MNTKPGRPGAARFVSGAALAGGVCLAALGIAGCSRNIKPPSTVPVSGTVLLKGKPAAGIRVKFHPQFDIGKVKYVPVGETGSDGRFTLSTGAPGNGAPPGNYAVTFEKPEIESARKSNYLETEIDAFLGRYGDPEDSAWIVTVERGENSLEPFELD